MSPNRYAHILHFASHPWALERESGLVQVIAMVLARHIEGLDTDPAVIAAAVAVRKDNLPPPVRGGVALIPVQGVIGPHMDLVTEASGGTSCDALSRAIQKAAHDQSVATIVLNMHSPGGSVAGVSELAATIRAVRAQKPVIAQVSYQSTSAAYWLAASATKIHASPSASVGSVGVFGIHDDLSEARAKLGIKREIIAAGKHKADGLQGEPLSDDGRAHLTAQIAKHYDRFVSDVAKGRGVAPAAVRESYTGKCVDADTALDLGMVDKICTLDETIERLLPAGSTFDAAALHSPAPTPQEPSPATGQEARVDASWQRRIDALLFDWQLS